MPCELQKRWFSAANHASLAFEEKAEAFKQRSSKNLLEKYPTDQTIQDAATVQAIAGKFAQEHIPDQEDRAHFLDSVRDWVTDNLEHGRENAVPRILEERSQDKDDLER